MIKIKVTRLCLKVFVFLLIWKMSFCIHNTHMCIIHVSTISSIWNKSFYKFNLYDIVHLLNSNNFITFIKWSCMSQTQVLFEMMWVNCICWHFLYSLYLLCSIQFVALFNFIIIFFWKPVTVEVNLWLCSKIATPKTKWLARGNRCYWICSKSTLKCTL